LVEGGVLCSGRERLLFGFIIRSRFYLFLFHIIEYADCVPLGFAIHPLRGPMDLSTALFYVSELFFSFLLFFWHLVLFLFCASLCLPPLSRMTFLLDVSLLICCCLPMSTTIDQSAFVRPFSSSSPSLLLLHFLRFLLLFLPPPPPFSPQPPLLQCSQPAKQRRCSIFPPKLLRIRTQQRYFLIKLELT